jgi:hypothetical protein
VVGRVELSGCCAESGKEEIALNLGRAYPDSLHEKDGSVLFLFKEELEKKLVVIGDCSAVFQELEGNISFNDGLPMKTCALSVANSQVIRKHFPYTRPISLRKFKTTIGLGDRLGVASTGHIQVVKGYNVGPVLAQQSIRELTLTGRTFEDVLSDAVWAVFQEGYRGGFGADGDHLKSREEVTLALEAGYTMITLDCSEYINDVTGLSEDDVTRLYMETDKKIRERLETRFLSGEFKLESGLTLTFSPESLRRNAVICQKAVDFAIDIFNELIKPCQRELDFEMSIDETPAPTDPLAHFFVTLQLREAGVDLYSVAPRFCGEFQKGIDYIGNLQQFRAELRAHQGIASHFGYKLSVHSGSDKFSVFPSIGEQTMGRVHVKTAGTNWLEAIRVIIHRDPGLYRELHMFALEKLDEARHYYHVTLNINRIPDVLDLGDNELEGLMSQNDARQLIHITYGLILQEKDDSGAYRFRDRIFRCLYENETLYGEFLVKHIGNHLKALGLQGRRPGEPVSCR